MRGSATAPPLDDNPPAVLPVGLIGSLEQAANQLAEKLRAVPGARPVPTVDFQARAVAAGTLRRPLVWRNALFTAPLWRRAHVEFFAIPGEIAVLHVCIFPALDCAAPIFGFDVIAGENKVTGCFLDLSPTTPAADPAIARWGASLDRSTLGAARVLPSWTVVFSPHVVAVRPRSTAELAACLALGCRSLEEYLTTPTRSEEPSYMRATQCRYVAAQRDNDRTLRVLAACIGLPLAQAFITEVLFPDPPTATSIRGSVPGAVQGTSAN
jgi:phycocyanobilin:ferredoxin oxidoreductase